MPAQVTLSWLKYDGGQMTLYADGGRIPFPNRKSHPPHIPTGPAGFEVFTFYPSLEEFKDFKGYVQKIEAVGAHRRSGICKIVAPEGWTPRPSKRKFKYKDDQVEHFLIQSPVKESVARQNDAILKSNHVYKKCMTASEFRKLAQSPKYRNPHPELQGKEMEAYYFKRMFNSHPIYGADTEGSFYDEGVDEFNMKKLNTILDETKNANGGKVIKGVNSVYLYFGMFGASFAWHVEDMELYSINFLHYGSPKYWFAIPPEAAPRFERLMRQQFPMFDRQCKAFMRHKSFIVLPSLLDMHKIPYGTMIQYPNEFIITFPHGYHMGWNLGYNIAESTNFATDRWIDFGKNAVLCKCRPDMVEIDMTPFMRKYRRYSFEKWYSYWYLPKPTLIIDAASSAATTMLWSNETVNFFAERTFNQSASKVWPHCAVCQYFQPLHMSTTTREIPQKSVSMALNVYWSAVSSSRLAFGLCFAKDKQRVPSADLTEDQLLTCTNCNVTVHPSCYGGHSNVASRGHLIFCSFTRRETTEVTISKVQGLLNCPKDARVVTGLHAHLANDVPDFWRCLRCKDRNDVAIRGTSCHLCELRGGALIPCRAGADICAFAHTVCAIFNRRTVFNDASNPSCCYTHPPAKQASLSGIFGDFSNYLPRDYVFAMGDDYESSRYQCDLCGNNREGLLRCSVCAEDGDPVLAHATCARQAGFLFERRSFPQITVMICDRHQKPAQVPLMDVNLGDIVIAWMDGGSRVQQGRVDRLVLRTLLTIDFEDGSISENTLPTDIVECGCIQREECSNGRHQPGSRSNLKEQHKPMALLGGPKRMPGETYGSGELLNVVEVKVQWNDGELYDGYYRCTAKTIEYTVVFPNGSSARLPRADLYGAGDAVPPEVRRRLRK
ncbi:unnamed protein product [Heligmosomoides polygyrus]|uniref:[histone H3]-trimethyl-L-lysine(9) demethylase n=1 Tax=Heligmosomoides polygyrus TaxID=6339 RepID=A0A183FWJ8_HELPZ|nr:unnamed protein product [Heligmosomoides polygyrus]